MDISVVIPVYGCRAALPALHERLTKALSECVETYEIILVEDCCPQHSWESIREICAQDPHVKGIHFSRNFGQATAVTAGVDQSCGDWVVVMDCDLQDRPEAIPMLYKKALEGYDVVFARRIARKDSAVTKALSRLFYRVYGYLADTAIDPSIGNFSIASRSLIDYYCKMREHGRAYEMFLHWIGFRQTAIDLDAEERFSGKSSYNLRKKLRLAARIITSFSNKPLHLMIRFGALVSFLAFVYILVLVIQKLMGFDYQMGWPSVIASVYLMGGMMLSAIGMVGIYIGNIFEETKNRPLYVIAETLNCQERSIR